MAGNNHRKPRPLISDDEIVRRQLASAAAKIGTREPLSPQPPSGEQRRWSRAACSSSSERWSLPSGRRCGASRMSGTPLRHGSASSSTRHASSSRATHPRRLRRRTHTRCRLIGLRLARPAHPGRLRERCPRRRRRNTSATTYRCSATAATRRCSSRPEPPRVKPEASATAAQMKLPPQRPEIIEACKICLDAAV